MTAATLDRTAQMLGWLAEDVAEALAAAWQFFEWEPVEYGVRQIGPGGDQVCDGTDTAEAAHIAHNDPQRVLRQCAAQRAVIELHQPAPYNVQGYQVCETCISPDDWTVTAFEPELAYPCPTLAAMYAGFEGREGWEG